MHANTAEAVPGKGAQYPLPPQNFHLFLLLVLTFSKSTKITLPVQR